MGAFDDLVPVAKTPTRPSSGAFDDLLPAKPAPSVTETALRGAAQGLLFGFADEGYGLTQGIRGMVSGEGFGAGYDRGTAEFRERERAGREANPVTAVASEIAGGLGTGLGLAKSGLTLMKAGASLPQTVGRGAIEGAAYGAAYGAGNAEGGAAERAAGAFDSAKTGAVIGGAVPVAARAIGAGISRAVTPLPASAERQALISTLDAEGIPLSAGQRSGSTPLRYAESIFGDATLAGGKASGAMTKQAEAFTDAAMQRMGGSGRATADNLSDNYARIGAQFDDLSARNSLRADQQMGRDLGMTLREYDRVLPAEQRRIVGELASDIVERFRDGGGSMAGKDYQTARSRLSRMAQNARGNDNEFADAIRGLRDTLDSGMMRSISPDDAAAWQQARREYGNYKTIAQAAGGAGANTAEGLISPQALRAATASGKNREAYARGQGDFAELTRAGNALMTPLPNSGTSQRNLVTGQVGGASGVLASGGDPITAAIIALGPSAFGRALWSGPVQKYLSNQAISPFAQKAIERKLQQALQGGAQSQSPRLGLPSP